MDVIGRLKKDLEMYDRAKSNHDSFISDKSKGEAKKMIDHTDSGILALQQAIKALEDQPKYEAALKMMANENIKDNSYEFCNACIDEDPSRSRYEGRVCQLFISNEGVRYTNECGRAAIVHYKNKVGLE